MRVIFLAIVLMCAGLPGLAQAQETLRLQFATEPAYMSGHHCFDSPGDSTKYDRYITVAWLELQSGNRYVRTLHRWGKSFVYNLENWAQASGMRVDGVTSATERCYSGQTCGNNPPVTATAQLDTGAVDISDLPDGVYNIRLEFTSCELADAYAGGGPSYAPVEATFTFAKNGTASSGGGDNSPFLGVSYTYSGRSGNAPPGVEAGPDLFVTPSGSPASASVALSGIATDDGGAPTVTWSQLAVEPAGGTASFTDAGSLISTVQFSHAGIYTLQLEASDGSLRSRDTLTVYVNTRFVPAIADAEVNTPWSNNTAMGRFVPGGPGAQAYSWGRSNGNHSRAYIKFDTSAISGSVALARLRIPQASQTPEASDIHDLLLMDDAADNWSEATLTFNNQPSGRSGWPVVGSYTHKTAPDPWIEIDVMQAFSAANNSNNILSFYVQPRRVDGDGNGMGIATRENLIEPSLMVVEGWQQAANVAPTAVASAASLVVDDGDGSELVSLDGTGSSDSDGQIVRYSWKEGASTVATGANAQATLALGIHDLVLEVEDNVGATDQDSVRVTVDDRYSGNDRASAAVAITGSQSGQSYNFLWVGQDDQGSAVGGDWFALNVSVRADLSVQLSGSGSGGDLDLRLFASDTSTVVDSSVTNGSSSESVAATQLDPGIYDLQVTAAGGETGASPYSLSVTTSGASSLTVTLSPVQAAENAGVLSAAGTVALPQAASSDITVSLTSSSTADLTVPASVTLASGQSSVAFDLSLVDNAAVDGTRVVTVTASASGVLSGSADFAVLDDDAVSLPSVQWSQPSLTVSEEDGAFAIEARLSAAATGVVDVPFTVGGSATSGADHDLSDGSLQIQVGQNSARRVVYVTFDQQVEGSETIVVTMQTPSGAILGANTVLTVTLLDADSSSDGGAADATAEDATSAGGTDGGHGVMPPEQSVGQGCACRAASSAQSSVALMLLLCGLLLRRYNDDC